MTKSELRRKIKNLIQEQSQKEDFSFISQKICKNIISNSVYKSADFIFAYMALNDEVNLSSLINESIKNGKSVFIPKIIPNTNKMDFYKYADKNQLEKGNFGILEPTQNEEKFELKNYDEKILVLVPGRAFSKNGERLGRGKSFYDSFLSDLKKFNPKNSVFAGVCFDFQIFPEIPTESHDVKMDFVFSK